MIINNDKFFMVGPVCDQKYILAAEKYMLTGSLINIQMTLNKIPIATEYHRYTPEEKWSG